MQDLCFQTQLKKLYSTFSYTKRDESIKQLQSQSVAVHVLLQPLYTPLEGWGTHCMSAELSLHISRLKGQQRRYRFSIYGSGRTFYVFTTSRPALGPTQPPTQWLLEAFFRGKICWVVNMTVRFYYRVSEGSFEPSISCKTSWCDP